MFNDPAFQVGVAVDKRGKKVSMKGRYAVNLQLEKKQETKIIKKKICRAFL
jgi:hypothetical protein